jgi:hypothetical protein
MVKWFKKILHRHVQKNLFITGGIVPIERRTTRKRKVQEQITQSELYFIFLIQFDTLCGCEDRNMEAILLKCLLYMEHCNPGAWQSCKLHKCIYMDKAHWQNYIKLYLKNPEFMIQKLYNYNAHLIFHKRHGKNCSSSSRLFSNNPKILMFLHLT